MSCGRGSWRGREILAANRASTAPLYLQRLRHGAEILGPRGIVTEPDVHIDVADLGYVVESRLPALDHRPFQVDGPDLPFRNEGQQLVPEALGQAFGLHPQPVAVGITRVPSRNHRPPLSVRLNALNAAATCLGLSAPERMSVGSLPASK